MLSHIPLSFLFIFCFYRPSLLSFTHRLSKRLFGKKGNTLSLHVGLGSIAFINLSDCFFLLRKKRGECCVALHFEATLRLQFLYPHMSTFFPSNRFRVHLNWYLKNLLILGDHRKNLLALGHHRKPLFVHTLL